MSELNVSFFWETHLSFCLSVYLSVYHCLSRSLSLSFSLFFLSLSVLITPPKAIISVSLLNEALPNAWVVV